MGGCRFKAVTGQQAACNGFFMPTDSTLRPTIPQPLQDLTPMSVSPMLSQPYPLPLATSRPTGGTPWSSTAPGSASPASDAGILEQALQRLGQIQHHPPDEIQIRHLGIMPPLSSGAQAVQLIRQRGIQVAFGDMGDSKAHAQWLSDHNLIMINQRYRGDSRPETLSAIASAIYHEAGHAAGNGDGQSSVQEELNCLALNVLGHQHFAATDPAYAHAASTSPLLSDGVALYPKLFFDPDPNKQALINRVLDKYGDLPLQSPGHAMLPPQSPTPARGPRMIQPLIYRLAEQQAATSAGPTPPPVAPGSRLNQHA